jgi:hypothetical protein
MNCVSWWGKRRLRGQSGDPSLNVLSMSALSSRPEFRPQPAPSGPASPVKQSNLNTVLNQNQMFCLTGICLHSLGKDKIFGEKIREGLSCVPSIVSHTAEILILRLSLSVLIVHFSRQGS